MEFNMHKSVLNCYNLNDNAVVLINIVSEKKTRIFQEKINDVEKA